MKRLIYSILGVAVVGLAGCQQGSSTASSTNPSAPGAKRVLKVTSPGEQTITQDQTDDFTISINRDNFTGPVDIKLENLPGKVKQVTTDMTIPDGKDSLTVTIKAEPDAGVVEDHVVTVTATAKNQTDMQPAKTDFKLDVKAKK
jgi:ABC-type glycerol-3-phosphate transport system substrate-binding protein